MNETTLDATDSFFRNFIEAYGRAWDHYDLATILDYYYTPCFIFKDGRVYDNVSEEAKRRYFAELLEDYRQQDVAYAEISHFELKRLGDSSALVTVKWVCKRANGAVVFDFWDAYHLIYIDGHWRILGDTVYGASQ